MINQIFEHPDKYFIAAQLIKNRLKMIKND